MDLGVRGPIAGHDLFYLGWAMKQTMKFAR